MTALSALRGQYQVTAPVPSWDDLLDGAVRLYWRRRHQRTDRARAEQAARLARDVERVRGRLRRHGQATSADVVRHLPGTDGCATAHVRAWEPLCLACLRALQTARRAARTLAA